MSVPRYVCPQCKEEDTLWEAAEWTGWVARSPELKKVDEGRDGPAECYGAYGCDECDWSGDQSKLLPVLDEPDGSQAADGSALRSRSATSSDDVGSGT